MSRVAATSGSGPLPRLGLAGMCLLGAVLSAALWLVGRSSAQARQRQGRRS